MSLRFEQFADATCAQAAFEVAFPPGSPAELALQALVDMGAQCKSVGGGKVACRYLENPGALAGWCWHLVIESGAERTISSAAISLAALGT